MQPDDGEEMKFYDPSGVSIHRWTIFLKNSSWEDGTIASTSECSYDSFVGSRFKGNDREKLQTRQIRPMKNSIR